MGISDTNPGLWFQRSRRPAKTVNRKDQWPRRDSNSGATAKGKRHRQTRPGLRDWKHVSILNPIIQLLTVGYRSGWLADLWIKSRSRHPASKRKRNPRFFPSYLRAGSVIAQK